jgi:hypothetical protein
MEAASTFETAEKLSISNTEHQILVNTELTAAVSVENSNFFATDRIFS